jgi:pullulanase
LGQDQYFKPAGFVTRSETDAPACVNDCAYLAGNSFFACRIRIYALKKGVENSYNSPDSINAIDWNLKTVNLDLFKYVSKLIKLRKEHPCFRMATAQQVSENIHFENGNPAGTIVYTINGPQ